MKTIIIQPGGNPPEDKKRFEEKFLPEALVKVRKLVTLELVPKGKRKTIHKVVGYNRYMMFISTTSYRSDFGVGKLKDVISELPSGGKLIVVTTRTDIYKESSLDPYRRCGNKMSGVNRVQGIVDIHGIEDHLPKLLSSKTKQRNLVDWDYHRTRTELGKYNKTTFTLEEVMETHGY